MKKIVSIFLCFICVLCLVQGAAAANYRLDHPVEVTPASGDLSPGDRVAVVCDISLTNYAEWTFPDKHNIEAYTELENPEWEYWMVKDDVRVPEDPVPVSKRYITYSGWELAYPDEVDIKIKYRLEGEVPEVSQTGNLIVFRLDQNDVDENLVSDGEVLVERTVINPGDIEATRNIRISELETLRKSIDEKYEMGVDTTAAEKKYDEADDAITASKTAASAAANKLLVDAKTYIDESEKLLDEFWTDKVIADTQAPLDKTGELLTYFKVNRSMSQDARVLNIDTKYNIAQGKLSEAKDLRNEEQYIQARIQAGNAKDKADEVCGEAVKLREDIGEGGIIPDVSGIGFYLAIIGVIVVVGIIGVIFYRRYTQWDELG